MKNLAVNNSAMAMHGSKTPDRDRQIGARLREFRTQIRWGQPDFAREIELTRDQLANIELGRSPLRYATAWRLRVNFNVNLEWLAGNGGIVNDPADDGFPSPEVLPMSPRCLFDDVVELVHEEKRKLADAFKPISEQNISKREVARLIIEGSTYDWIARVPDDYIMNLANAVCAAAEDCLKKCPADPADLVNARAEKLQWERVRQTAGKRLIVLGKKSEVDKLHHSADNPFVRLTWEQLRKRLEAATAETGKQAAAAAFVGVNRSNLYRWVNGEREPGAEATFRLLEWVTAEEAKTKSPGSVSAPPEQMARTGDQANENKSEPDKGSHKKRRRSS